MLLAARSQAQRLRWFGPGVPGDHARIDGVCLLQPAHALGELAHRARVHDGHGKVLFGQLREGLLFVAAGGFHGHQLNLMSVAEGGQCGDAFQVVEERSGGAVAADRGLQRRR